MRDVEFSEKISGDVRGQTPMFEISAGPLSLDRLTLGGITSDGLTLGGVTLKGVTLQDAYVIEVDYKDSQDRHPEARRFGSMLTLDFQNRADDLAHKFCEDRGFKVHSVLNFWPTYQAVISRKSQQ